MTERQPNRANLVSDPQEEGFAYTIIDDDGISWYAAPTERPSAFVKWVPSPTIQRLSAASRLGARVRKLLKAFSKAFRRRGHLT